MLLWFWMEFFKQSIGLENCIVRLCTIHQIKLHGYFIKSGLCNPVYKSSSIFFEFSNHPKVSYIILDWSLLFMTPFAAHCGKGLIGWKSMSMIMSLLTTWKPVLVFHQDPCLTHFHWNDKLYTISKEERWLQWKAILLCPSRNSKNCRQAASTLLSCTQGNRR